MSSSDESKAVATEKDADNVEPAKVHSANSWESADLGDDERKKKFLKLMGASKSEHHGRFFIGEKRLPANAHARDKRETEDINKELEDQYKHTLEHRITKWSHKGLGYEKEENNEAGPGDNKSSDDKDSKPNTDKPSDNDKQTRNTSSDETSKKRESEKSTENNESPPKKPKMMMSFVKASD